jgi:hypothetical protein
VATQAKTTEAKTKEKSPELEATGETVAIAKAQDTLKILATTCERSGSPWPCFATPADLQASPKWLHYLISVYGASVHNPRAYPIDISEFWMLDHDKLLAAGHDVAAFQNYEQRFNCPNVHPVSQPGDVFVDMSGVPPNTHDPPGSLWIYHPTPFKGLPAHTRVEVTHCSFWRIRYEKVGYWMYFAPGSGVFYDLGETRVYEHHRDAVLELLPGKDCNNFECEEHFDELFQVAARTLKSLQFLNNPDQRCGLSAIEVVDLHHSGLDNCLPQVFGGLKGQCPCKCNQVDRASELQKEEEEKNKEHRHFTRYQRTLLKLREYGLPWRADIPRFRKDIASWWHVSCFAG